MTCDIDSQCVAFFLLMQPNNFPYKEEIMSVNPTCLVVIILLFISIILAFKVSALLCIRSTSDHGWNVPCWEVCL